MSELVCTRNGNVSDAHLQKTEVAASDKFPMSNSVKEQELLSEASLKRRAAKIDKATGLHVRTTNNYAEMVKNELKPHRSLDWRTNTNLARLFSSERVKTSEIIKLIKLMKDPNQVTAFREAAQKMFLSAQLFYYDYFPHEGSVFCYINDR